MKNLLEFLKLSPKLSQPTMESYGQTNSGVEQQQIQAIMEWLLASLMGAGYFKKSHIIWYDDTNPDPKDEQLLKKLARQREPVFLYRCGNKVQRSPKGYCWRMMEEHPSLRVYQLEMWDVE